MRADQYSSNTANETAAVPWNTSEAHPSLEKPLHPAAVGGFGQTFGLHPGMAALVFIVDLMLFTGEVGSLGTSFPISLAASVVLGIITFMAQKKWYGDDNENAFIKALILAFLTAIPTPLPAALYLPAGLIGLVHNLRKGN